MFNNWLNKFYTVFHFLYNMTLAIDAIDGCGFSNKPCCELYGRLLGRPVSSQTIACLLYKQILFVLNCW